MNAIKDHQDDHDLILTLAQMREQSASAERSFKRMDGLRQSLDDREELQAVREARLRHRARMRARVRRENELAFLAAVIWLFVIYILALGAVGR